MPNLMGQEQNQFQADDSKYSDHLWKDSEKVGLAVQDTLPTPHAARRHRPQLGYPLENAQRVPLSGIFPPHTSA